MTPTGAHHNYFLEPGRQSLWPKKLEFESAISLYLNQGECSRRQFHAAPSPGPCE